jgi:dienelactone hydrolase
MTALQGSRFPSNLSGDLKMAATDVPLETIAGEEADNGPRMRRWTEQRWLIDNIIRSVGMEWDQPRLAGLLAALGPESAGDIAGIRARVQKYADIAPAFEAAARRREARAAAAEKDGERIVARENYFMAANFWCSAQWPIHENNETNLRYNERKRACFLKYAGFSDHTIEAAWIPLPSLKGKSIPGWLHLPPDYKGGRIPAVISIPGMDGFKERFVPLYGDRWLARGVAVLTLEGPGQTECPVIGIPVSMQGWAETGTAVYEWLAARPEIDPARIGMTGSSFGSFFSTIAFGNEPRIAACAVYSTCLEPGHRSILEEASPTYKRRFMYMSGYTDEQAFDEFARTLTWEGHAEKIKSPYLCIAGEFDPYSPLPSTERLFSVLKGPKRLVIYQGAAHGVGGIPSATLGPYFPTLIAEWMMACFAGKRFESERWFVDALGKISKTPF